MSQGSADWGAVLPAFLVLFVAALPLARRHRSLFTVCSATAAGQLVLHFWLAWAGEHHAMAHGGHPMHASQHDPHAMWHAGQHGGTAMTAAHVLAALLVAWCLQRADAAGQKLVRLAAGMVRRLGDALVALARTVVRDGRLTRARRQGLVRAVRARAQSPPDAAAVLTYEVVRRGPPTMGAFPVARAGRILAHPHYT